MAQQEKAGRRLWRRWTLFTAAGEFVGFAAPALAMTAGTVGHWTDMAEVVSAGLAGAVEGAVLGLPQWLVLRHHLPKAGWWMPANAFAWPVGVAVPFIVLALVPAASPFWVWAVAGIASGVLMGLVVGAITGLVLVRLWRLMAGDAARVG